MHGTFFPFLWQTPRPNLITYNFISTHGQHRRINSISPNRYGPRPGQLTAQSSLFGLKLLSVPNGRLPIQPLPINIGGQNVFGSFPFGRGGHYDVPLDALVANYLRPSIPFAEGPPTDFRTPSNPVLPPPTPDRPEFPHNFFIPPFRPERGSNPFNIPFPFNFRLL